MDVMIRIMELVNKEGIAPSRLATQLGLPNNAFTEWNKGKAKPSLDAVVKMADYFEVSVDYLLGRTDRFIEQEYAGVAARGGASKKMFSVDEDDFELLRLLNEHRNKHREDAHLS